MQPTRSTTPGCSSGADADHRRPPAEAPRLPLLARPRLGHSHGSRITRTWNAWGSACGPTRSPACDSTRCKRSTSSTCTEASTATSHARPAPTDGLVPRRLGPDPGPARAPPRPHVTRWADPSRVDRHHARGRLDARQRIEALFDPGTLVKLGTLVTSQDESTRRATRWSPGSGTSTAAPPRRGRGLHGPGRVDRQRRGTTSASACASSPRRSGCRWCSCSKGAGHRLVTKGMGRQAQRPPGPRRPLGARADGVPRARLVGRARRAHRAAVRLHDHDRGRVAVHRRAAAGEGRDRRGHHQGGAGRTACTSTCRAWPTTSRPTTASAIALARRYLSYFPTRRVGADPRAVMMGTPRPGGSRLCST